MDKKKMILIASSGGHYQQICMLKSLEDKYRLIVVTEKTQINYEADYYLKQVNRKERFWYCKMFNNTLKSIKILLLIRPNVIVSTGALAVIPMLALGKLFGVKVIFIESFAKTKTGTMTGKLVYKFADLFIVQWESLLEVYPKATFGGGIY